MKPEQKQVEANDKKDFALFQEHFKEYQHRFGLTGYKVYFKHEPLNSAFAKISIESNDMVAMVTLNSKLPSKDSFKDIKRSAKHEAIHLLLNKLETKALDRYLRDGEIYETVEELVFKLEELINE